MLRYLKKRLPIAFSVMGVTYQKVVRQNFWKFFSAVFLGGLSRGLHIISFVLVLQMLIMAVLPDNKKAELLAKFGKEHLSHFGITAEISPIMMLGFVMLIVLVINISAQFTYQRLLGRIIENVRQNLDGCMVADRQDMAHLLKAATTMTVSSVKISEIAGFMLVLVLLIGFVNIEILAICLALCALAVVLIVLVAPKRLRMAQNIADFRAQYAKKPDDVGLIKAYTDSVEYSRFRAQFSGSIETFIIGLATILLVLFIQVEDISLTGAASYQVIFLVFSVRYAFSYMREFSKNISVLLDLRRSLA